MSRSTVTASTFVIWVHKSVLESLNSTYKYCNRAESESRADELTVTALMVQFFLTPEPHLVGPGIPEQTANGASLLAWKKRACFFFFPTKLCGRMLNGGATTVPRLNPHVRVFTHNDVSSCET